MSQQFIARWYHREKRVTSFGYYKEPIWEPRESFVTADNPSHAEQLIKQMDPSAAAIRLEKCGAYTGP